MVKEGADKPSKSSQSGSGSWTGVFMVALKFILAIAMLPIVMGTTFGLQNELSTFAPGVRQTLFVGVLSYVLLRFFVYDFMPVYTFGQGIVTTVFQFLKPLVTAAPYVLPIYTIFILIVYAILTLMGKMTGEWQLMFIFFLSFTFYHAHSHEK